MIADQHDPRVAVDPNALENLRRFGGDALLSQLVTLFREQVRVRTEAMRVAAAAGDTLAARQASHSLKSSAGQIGATGMQELCKQIERAAMDGDAESVKLLVTEFDFVTPAIDSWLTDRGFPKES